MSEINARWQRDNRFVKRLTGYGVALAVALWPISYYASFPAAKEGQGMWFAAISVIALVAAIGVTIGTAIGAGAALTDEPPLEGSNY